MTLSNNALNSNNPNSDDLHWLAYRYSAGELSPAEALEFEARLEHDQAAREALAQAVGLTETVCALERGAASGDAGAKTPVLVPASTARRNWLQPVGWVAAGAAACLAVVMAWQSFKAGEVEMAQRNVAPPVVAKQEPIDDETRLLLALLDEAHARSTAIDDLSSDELSGSGPAELGAPEFELVIDDAAADEATLDEQNMTPDWLLAAVAESKS